MHEVFITWSTYITSGRVLWVSIGESGGSISDEVGSNAGAIEFIWINEDHCAYLYGYKSAQTTNRAREMTERPELSNPRSTKRKVPRRTV